MRRFSIGDIALEACLAAHKLALCASDRSARRAVEWIGADIAIVVAFGR